MLKDTPLGVSDTANLTATKSPVRCTEPVALEVVRAVGSVDVGLTATMSALTALIPQAGHAVLLLRIPAIQLLRQGRGDGKPSS